MNIKKYESMTKCRRTEGRRTKGKWDKRLKGKIRRMGQKVALVGRNGHIG